jgi:hypothetical protein
LSWWSSLVSHTLLSFLHSLTSQHSL